jgi:predicted transcriptional regulator
MVEQGAPTNDSRLHVPIPTELHEEVRQLAKKEDRSVSSLTRQALQRAVQEAQGAPA